MVLHDAIERISIRAVFFFCAACRERLRALNASAPLSASDEFERNPVAFIRARYAHAQIPTHVVLFDEHVESLSPTLTEWRFKKVHNTCVLKMLQLF